MNYATIQKFAIQKENRVYVFEFAPPATFEEIDAVLIEFKEQFLALKNAQLEKEAQNAQKQESV